MTTHRDLAEADAFHRRRLVGAFVSGAGAGHHIDPPRAGRCLLGGLLLAAVLIAVTAAAAALTGHPAVGWHDVMTRLSR